MCRMLDDDAEMFRGDSNDTGVRGVRFNHPTGTYVTNSSAAPVPPPLLFAGQACWVDVVFLYDTIPYHTIPYFTGYFIQHVANPPLLPLVFFIIRTARSTPSERRPCWLCCVPFRSFYATVVRNVRLIYCCGVPHAVTYEQSMSAPEDDELERAATKALLPNVQKIQTFFELARDMEQVSYSSN